MKNTLITLALGLALALSVGCQSTGSNPSGEVLAQAAVVYATAKVIENNPAYAPRIAQIAAEVRAVSAGEAATTVDMVISLARAKIDWASLSPADAALVNLLLDAVKAELTARLGAAELPTDKLLVVAKVAGWIEQAAIASTPTA